MAEGMTPKFIHNFPRARKVGFVIINFKVPRLIVDLKKRSRNVNKQ